MRSRSRSRSRSRTDIAVAATAGQARPAAKRLAFADITNAPLEGARGPSASASQVQQHASQPTSASGTSNVRSIRKVIIKHGERTSSVRIPAGPAASEASDGPVAAGKNAAKRQSPRKRGRDEAAATQPQVEAAPLRS